MLRRRLTTWLAAALRYAAVSIICITISGTGHAQGEPDQDAWHTKRWVGDVAFAGANSLVAGLTAGVLQELRDGSFRDGFARGALGGAIAYGGRRIAAEGFWGAGLVGRQISALGISVTRNAAENHSLLRDIWLPVGPLIIKVNYVDDLKISARPDVFASGWVLAAILDERLDFDAASSISSGAPVFRAPGHRLRSDGQPIGGAAVGGVVVIGQHSDDLLPGEVFAHERVHVLQYDFAQLLWGEPLEELSGRYMPYVPLAQRHVRFGVLLPLLAGGLTRLTGIGGPDTIWELEAYYLDDR